MILGKVLIACETAMKDFKSIVMSVGGKEEKERAAWVNNT